MTELQERIARAIYGSQEHTFFPDDLDEAPKWLQVSVRTEAAAVLPILRAAQADARDEGYAACYARRLQSDRWPYPDEDEQAEKEYAEVCGRSAATRAPNPYREKEN